MGKAGVGGASGVPPFFLFPFWAFRSAPSGKVRSWGAPRETSRAVGLGRGASLPFLRWLRTLGRVVVGGAPWGALGVGFGGFGLLAFFPFGTAIFAPFRPKSQVFPASFLILFGELPATKRRRPRRPFVTKFAVSSPFAAWAFSFLLYARRGSAPQFAASPCESPGPRNFAASPCESRPGPPPNFAASPWKSPPGRPVFHFAVRKSTTPPGFPTSPWRSSPLRRGKVRQTTRFSTSPCESPPARPVFRFAVVKSTRLPGFSASPCRRFAVAKEGGLRSPGSP